MSRVRYGIKNVHYALVKSTDNGTYTYDAPKPLKGAVSISLSEETNSIKEYADNGVWYQGNSLSGYTGSIEVEDLEKAIEAELLGHKIDSKGGMIVKDTDDAPEIALLFEFALADAKATAKRGILYRCKLAKKEEKGTTKEDKITIEHTTLDVSASARPDGLVKYSCESTDAELFGNWFTAVPEPAQVAA